MDPKIWGNHAWIFLHMITFNYPENPTPFEKNNMKQFFNNLSNVLPCSSCGLNLKKHLLHRPLNDNVLSSRTQLIKWLYDIHNMINVSINKKQYSWNEFIKKYDNMKNKMSNKKKIYILLIIIAIIVSLFILIIYNIKNRNNTRYNTDSDYVMKTLLMSNE